MSWTAHDSAIVEAGAEIGDDTRIWHHSHVRSGAVIGGDTSLGKNVYIDAGVTIGNRVKVQNNVSVYQGVTVADDVRSHRVPLSAPMPPSCVGSRWASGARSAQGLLSLTMCSPTNSSSVTRRGLPAALVRLPRSSAATAAECRHDPHHSRQGR